MSIFEIEIEEKERTSTKVVENSILEIYRKAQAEATRDRTRAVLRGIRVFKPGQIFWFLCDGCTNSLMCPDRFDLFDAIGPGLRKPSGICFAQVMGSSGYKYERCKGGC